jgi:hypothetical protein
MKPNSFGSRLVKEERRCGVENVAAQFIPSITLSENALRQAFCTIAAIGLLDCFKHQIGHIGPSYGIVSVSACPGIRHAVQNSYALTNIMIRRGRNVGVSPI